MPTDTYQPLANITLGSSSSSVTFSSIPATYRDLVLVVNGSPTTTAYPSIVGRLNGDTGSNYTAIKMSSDGASGSSSLITSSDLRIANDFGAGNSTTGRFVIVATLMDYSATDKHKTLLSRSGSTSPAGTEALAARWANTAAVTSFQVFVGVSAFAAGSTFALYGIAS